jgi:YfiH family protein
MIAFTVAVDGDMRRDDRARAAMAARLGIDEDWATVDQVHGAEVRHVERAGSAGAADGLFTTRRNLPVAVFTADCFPVGLLGPGGVGMAHAGWRGAVAGVVPALWQAMDDAGVPPERAVVGPGIRSCCFEVGAEVAGRFPDHGAVTRWDTQSVDLLQFLLDQLSGLSVTAVGDCTRCHDEYLSFRRDGTEARMGAIAWRP